MSHKHSIFAFIGCMAFIGTSLDCGGKAVIDGEPGGGGAAASSNMAAPAAATNGSSVVASSSSGSTDDLLINILGTSLSADCMPIVPEDPLRASVEFEITNLTGQVVTLDETVVFTVDRLDGPSPDAVQYALSFGMPVDIEPGVALNLLGEKSQNTADANACILCGPVNVTVSIDTNLGPVSATSATELGCAF